LSQTERIKHIDLSENDIGKKNFVLLLDIFKSNSNIQTINVADCNIDGNCVEKMCSILKATNT
jgi:Ran GTPase-activating protein (RanGAP) involved in mRNA processing and transport